MWLNIKHVGAPGAAAFVSEFLQLLDISRGAPVSSVWMVLNKRLSLAEGHNN